MKFTIDEFRAWKNKKVTLLGMSGVGKTYMMRCVAKLIGVPFVKADATKFSETGYVGHDVEDLVRDLVKAADGDVELALAGYNAGEAAVDKYTRDLAAELRGSNVLVNALDPGWLRTDMGGPDADHEVTTVLPGALQPALLEDDGPSGQRFRAQDYAERTGATTAAQDNTHTRYPKNRLCLIVFTPIP